MIKRILKILLWILISVSFIMLTYVVNNDRKDLVIKDFNIEIVDSIRNEFVLKKDIIRILKNTNGNLKGLRTSNIDRDKIERKLDRYNHLMEFIRTLTGVTVLVLQIIIITRLFK